ncbi:MAG: TRAP transporter substrate-binding protein [Clostridiales bacterium]|nr:TRAP transporter substrate-binding protein [Clostridiales bacterium]
MKKVLCLVLVAAMMLSLAACTGSSQQAATTTTTETAAATQSSGTSAAAAPSAGEQTAEVYPFIISHADPLTANFHRAYMDVEAYLEASGLFDVTIHGNGELTSNEAEGIQQCIDGEIQMTQCPSFVLAAQANVPGYYVYDYPMFLNEEEYKTLAASDLMDDLAQQVYEKTGLKVGRAWVNGWFCIGVTSPVNSLDDLKGIKARASTATLTVAYLKELGMNPISMLSAEVYTGLQQGTIDGVYTPMRIFYDNKYYEVIRYIYRNNGSVPMQLPLVNGEYYNSLPEEHRKVLDEALELFSNNVYKYAMEMQEDAIKEMVADGVVIVEPTEEEMATLKAAADKVLAEYAGEAGQDYIDRANAILGR